MDELLGDERDALRAKLNIDLRKLFHRIIFKPEGAVAIELFGPVGAKGRTIKVRKPDENAMELRTVEDILNALNNGELVFMSPPAVA
jgi:hypothetical protein